MLVLTLWIARSSISEVAAIPFSTPFQERQSPPGTHPGPRKREVDTVIVWKLDRWGTSAVDFVTTLKELGDLGVGFISLTEALDH